MTRTTKLNDTQLVILSTAAARGDRLALPLPECLQANDPETSKAFASLLKRGLLEEIEIPTDAIAWRSHDERRIGLRATPKALDALGIDEAHTDGGGTPPTEAPAQPRGRAAGGKNATGSKSAGTKCEQVLTLLRRKSGASIEDMTEATGWQAHSVRGFVSGTIKKRMGLEVISEKNAKGERRYRVKAA